MKRVTENGVVWKHGKLENIMIAEKLDPRDTSFWDKLDIVLINFGLAENFTSTDHDAFSTLSGTLTMVCALICIVKGHMHMYF